jgi:hypothetical protein
MVIIDGWLKIAPIPVISDNHLSAPKALNDQFNLSGILFAIILYFEYRIYYFFLPKQRSLVLISAILFFAGMYGSCFNQFAYNHGYDYIEIEHLMVLDIKDVYLELGIYSCFLLFAESIPFLKKYKTFTSLKPKIIEYLKWERTTWCIIFRRINIFLQTHRKVKKKDE